MKLKDLKMPEGAATSAPAASTGGSGPQPGSDFKVAPVFDQIKAELAKVCEILDFNTHGASML